MRKKTCLLGLLVAGAAAHAQTSITAREAFPVDPAAGVTGDYGFTAFPGQAKALAFSKTGAPPYVVTLGGAQAGAATALPPASGSVPLDGTPDLFILTQDSGGSAFWAAFYRVLQVHSSSYALGPVDYGQTAHITRDASGHLRLMQYSGGGVSIGKLTTAATVASSGALSVVTPSVTGFTGKWLESPPGSELLYEFMDGYQQVRVATYTATGATLGTPYPLTNAQRARLYWAGGTTTYDVTIGGGGISIVELGPSSATPRGSFGVTLPAGTTCSGCRLSDLEIAQESFPGYPSGAIIAVFSNKLASPPPSAVLALVDWADIAGLLGVSTKADVSAAASLDPAPAVGGGGGGSTGGTTVTRPAPLGPGIPGSSTSGCSASGTVGPTLVALLLLGVPLLAGRRRTGR